MKIMDFTPREYQRAIADTAKTKNTLIILPTGLGKTKTAILIAIERMNLHKNSKVLILTPTKPLAEQIANEFMNSSDVKNVSVFTGAIQPKKRRELWKNSQVVVATPQTVSHDIVNKRISLKDVSLFCVDEAHRSVGEYDSVWVSRQYIKEAEFPRIIGLTASPGTDKPKIEEICSNLFVEEVEVRTEEDEDVKQYVQEIDVNHVYVELPEDFLKIKNHLERAFFGRIDVLKKLKVASYNLTSKKMLIYLQKSLQGKVASGHRNPVYWSAISVAAEAIKIQHALELIETQGISALYKYMNGIYTSAESSKVKANKSVANNPDFQSAFVIAERLIEEKVEHPKLVKLKEILKEEVKEGIKVIIFTQYRDSASKIVEEINKLNNVNAEVFVGQMRKSGTGLSQKKQIELLDRFKSGDINCIVSTSIGEEGLDIPKVDLVVFYEPIPSAIRSIQRRGRTARQKKGRMIMLVTKNTRDESYRWTAHHKKKKMYRLLDKIKNKVKLKGYTPKDEGVTLNDFVKTSKIIENKKEVEIICDTRERNSGIIKVLMEEGKNVVFRTLESADYVIGNRVGIEFKTKRDFLDSIITKRIFSQIALLKQNFERPVLIVEGEEDIYSIRKIHPNSIRGMLSSIIVDYGVSVIYTKNPEDTGKMILSMANRESQRDIAKTPLRKDKKPLNLKQQQEFIIESLPSSGPVIAKSLLKEMGSVKNVVNASVDDLMKAEKVGKKTAERMKRVIEKDYTITSE